MKNGPLISVIVPVYNVEKYLSRCVDSIRNQTYQNLEIILVEDGSTDASAEIAKEYAELDQRVQVISHEENKGLFQARITGVTHATGKYIAFVDSDDYISIDWFYQLLKKAEATDADITVGEWCFDHEGGDKVYCNLDPFRIHDYELNGEEVLDAFMEQAGKNYSWTVVWNKLYRADLWKDVMSRFKQFSEEHGHMVMWEDIVFSSGLWMHAQKMSNVHHINYFYYKSKAASTAINKDYNRNVKYIHDSSTAMKFMKQMLTAVGAWEAQEKNYNNWLALAASIVYQDLVVDLASPAYEKIIRESFDFNGKFQKRNLYFYSMQTKLHPAADWYDDIKREITSPKTKYVSFDIFDTLVLRPFFYPTDLFACLSDKLNASLHSYVDFMRIRFDAEARCRQKVALCMPSKEDINLDEIYATIQENYSIDAGLLSELKEYEIAMELKYCKIRKTGRDLYELARDSGKKIIICSDMYLPQHVIEKILANNGYTEYEKLYLSSEIELTKATRNLYKYVLKDLGNIEPDSIVHIGDNWQSDIENAKKSGFRIGHLAKTVDMLQNLNPGIYSGQAHSNVFNWNGAKTDYRAAFDGYTIIRSIQAMVANKCFDNPYVSYHPDSDFNANPSMIGYATLGPHLLSLCSWLMETAAKEQVPTIHFVARDGFLVKKAFDCLNNTSVKSSYIRLSRRSLMLADVNVPEDIYSLFTKINVLRCTPLELSAYLEPIIRPGKDVAAILEKNGLYKDRKFKTVYEYEKCMKVFIDQIIEMDLLDEYKEKLKQYFTTLIKPGDYIFDIGYSGRPEAALSNLLGYPVGSFYIHVNSDVAKKRQQRYDCPCYCFYGYKPCITGVMREHLMMELGPSTIGYEEKDGTMVPVLEEYTPNYESDLITTFVQEGALQFIEEFCSIFREESALPELPSEACSAMYEYYLHYSKPFDRQIFSSLSFEDKLGVGRELSALEFWNNEIAVHRLETGGVWNASGNPLAAPVPALADLYADGLFVKLYVKLNRFAPKGSRKREWLKKIAGLFIK